MKTTNKQSLRLRNKKASFLYTIEEKIEAGMVLSGGEARAIRTGHINLGNAYAKIINNEVYLVNADIPVSGAKNYNQTRSRKLLLKRAEILNLEIKMKQKKLTLVPLGVYTKGRLIKLELGLGKGKKEHEKREYLKKKDLERELRRGE